MTPLNERNLRKRDCKKWNGKEKCKGKPKKLRTFNKTYFNDCRIVLKCVKFL